MQLDEQLRKKTKLPENRERFIVPDDEEEEETYLYDDRKRTESLNAEKSGVFDSAFGGINSEKNVFDRTCVFRTGQ